MRRCLEIPLPSSLRLGVVQAVSDNCLIAMLVVQTQERGGRNEQAAGLDPDARTNGRESVCHRTLVKGVEA